jgi:hypothetical protein
LQIRRSRAWTGSSSSGSVSPSMNARGEQFKKYILN